MTAKNGQSYNHPSHHPVLYSWESCTPGASRLGTHLSFAASCCPSPMEVPVPLPQYLGSRTHVSPPSLLLFFCQGRLWPLFHTPWPDGTLPSTPSPTGMKQGPPSLWPPPCPVLSPVFQAESEDARHIIIPLLHTLMYVLTKVSWAEGLGGRGDPASDWAGHPGDTGSLPGKPGRTTAYPCLASSLSPVLALRHEEMKLGRWGAGGNPNRAEGLGGELICWRNRMGMNIHLDKCEWSVLHECILGRFSRV